MLFLIVILSVLLGGAEIRRSPAGNTPGWLGSAARPAHALSPFSTFRVATLRHGGAGGHTELRPGAYRRLIWEVLKRTSIPGEMEPLLVRASVPRELFASPFLVMMGDRGFPPLSEREITNLRLHLEMGGMLFIDSLGAGPDSEFDQSVRRMVNRLFPEIPLRPISDEHVLFKSFYLLEQPYGRVAQFPHFWAVSLEQRVAILYSHNDLPGAWSRDPLGVWVHDVVPGGEGQRERAFRMGVNIVMYALTMDYKEDQVHVPSILKKRRWRTRIGEE